MSNIPRCPECGVYWPHGEAHSWTWDENKEPKPCSRHSRESLEALAVQYYKAWRADHEANKRHVHHLIDIATKWQGKHAILRHENNKLRDKLKKFEAAVKARSP